ncbi:unnamed protein product [Orchesella dallaii]|uniref:beta-galactoside alpha-(2,6)-sialyltransferase n=1 Tax=Orchesella dallaii TaxID=48710 RepID=A0ABP1R4D1_9HEXA
MSSNNVIKCMLQINSVGLLRPAFGASCWEVVESEKKTMKILPLFIILFFFSGAIIFTYLAWTTLRDRDDQTAFFTVKGPRRTFVLSDGKSGSSQIAEDENENDDGLGLLTVNENELLGSDMQKKIEILKMRVVSKLRRHILDGSKVKGHINHYGVNYTKLKSKVKVNQAAVLCRIKKVSMGVLDQSSSPLFEGKRFPAEPLFSSEAEERSRFESGYSGDTQSSSDSRNRNTSPLYRSCAVIPNSAALDGAKHGIDIDSHDFILRFNNAPTQGFEDDVGALTSMRIINSQVATKPTFGFPTASYYTDMVKVGPTANGILKRSTNSSNVHSNAVRSSLRPTPLVVNNYDSLWEATRKFLIWDPCNYGSSIEQWYKSPDFPLFGKYFNITSSQTMRDRNRFYILDCRVIWKLWEILQEFSFTRIHGTPPTSGFIGISTARK